MKVRALAHAARVPLLSALIACTIVLTAFGAPDDYTIRKGDTLWDISSERLKDPYQWPSLWKANPKIRNPHLIYPGQKLNIPDRELMKSETTGKEVTEPGTEQGKVVIPEKLEPRRIPVQEQHYIVPRDIFLTSGFIDNDIKIEGEVKGESFKRNLMGRGDTVYVSLSRGGEIESGTRYYVVSKPEGLLHPTTGKRLGFYSKIKGLLETTGEDNGKQRARILESYDEILKEDILIGYYPIEVPGKPLTERKPQLKGVVVKNLEGLRATGRGGLVIIDKGQNEKVQVGDQYTLITGTEPFATSGTIQVIKTFPSLSIAVVGKSEREVMPGDIYKN
ncbi:MAG: LysM peptidoglycan-binding domain-containing protein [Alphaproteobacteria bacterium]|uniref:LysM peptidoglycan-binding domain-containing protein n=1 Tax=Candidatus Nitrobium versatile TaxID=2884831 RepID=A0A953M3U6_9BACT|nr:LysM peptidoglycan-binding domain-containing protein [Candidatus Nitrobium versatile]